MTHTCAQYPVQRSVGNRQIDTPEHITFPTNMIGCKRRKLKPSFWTTTVDAGPGTVNTWLPMLLTVLLDADSAWTASLHHYTILLLDDVMVTVWVSLVTQQLWVQFPVILLAGNNLRQVVHTHTCRWSVSKQYKLEWRCPVAEKVTIGLASHRLIRHHRIKRFIHLRAHCLP